MKSYLVRISTKYLKPLLCNLCGAYLTVTSNTLSVFEFIHKSFSSYTNHLEFHQWIDSTSTVKLNTVNKYLAQLFTLTFGIAYLVQSKYVGTGHADTIKHEWLSNQQRDSLASIAGHNSLLSYISVAENECKARVKANLLEKMLQPCGPPPVKEDQ